MRSTFLICKPCAEARKCKFPKYDLWMVQDKCAYCNQPAVVYCLTELIAPWEKDVEQLKKSPIQGDE